MTEYIAYSLAEHPAPYRDRVRLSTIFYGMFAAPIMWAGNFMIDYGLVSWTCYPGYEPLASGQPGLGYIYWLTLAFYLLTLLVCISGFAVARHCWLVTGPARVAHPHDLVTTGEDRTRYFGMIGMSFSVLFFIATAAGLLIYAFEPLCAY